jgi:hypothetical protein
VKINKIKKNPTAIQVILILHEGAQTAHVHFHFDRDFIPNIQSSMDVFFILIDLLINNLCCTILIQFQLLRRTKHIKIVIKLNMIYAPIFYLGFHIFLNLFYKYFIRVFFVS